jgi:hypothetical protein
MIAAIIDRLSSHEAFIIGMCCGWVLSTAGYIIIEAIRPREVPDERE